MRLYDKRKRHWRMVFEDNDGGVYGQKSILHAKRWCGYSVEVSGSDGKKVLWEVVDDHVVEEGKEHDDIGLCES